MAWILLGLVIYYFLLLSERVLVGISPHQLEQLRTDNSFLSRCAQRLMEEIRPSLSALLLARLFLKILLTVCSVSWLARVPAVRSTLYQVSERSAAPGWLIWGIAGAGVAAALAALFRGLQQINRPALAGDAFRVALKNLGPFILFWRLLLAPVLPKSRPAHPAHAALPPQPVNTTATGFNGEQQSDLELLKSIVKFSDVTVKQVMQPRSKVVAVDFRTRFNQLLETVREAGFSRLPVYDEDLDNVTGILYVKDLVPHLDKPDDFEWQSLIRTNLVLVPEAKRVSELLQEFKRNRRHMAIVIDEYGGSSGIVTMEDILEEVTGEIRDEFDEENEIRYRKLDDYNYLFEGQTLLNDVCQITGLAADTFDEVRGAADTLAGLALELKGDIPKPGTELVWNDYLLTVIAADNRRIEQLKLTIAGGTEKEVTRKGIL